MFSNGSCTSKFRKRDKVWRNSTGSFEAHIETKEELSARSYNHWLFLTVINGLVVFNDYSYSTSTSGHQSEARRLIKGKYKIDVEVNQRASLDKGIDLSELYEEALLCAVKLSKKGLRQKTREGLESDLNSANKNIERLVKAKVCKAYSKKQIKELKSKIQAQEEERLSEAREANKAKREAINTLKPELSNLSAVKFEEIEGEMNSLNEINVK